MLESCIPLKDERTVDIGRKYLSALDNVRRKKVRVDIDHHDKLTLVECSIVFVSIGS